MLPLFPATLVVTRGEESNTVQVLSGNIEATGHTAVSEPESRKESLRFSGGGLRSTTAVVVLRSGICYKECNILRVQLINIVPRLPPNISPYDRRNVINCILRDQSKCAFFADEIRLTDCQWRISDISIPPCRSTWISRLLCDRPCSAWWYFIDVRILVIVTINFLIILHIKFLCALRDTAVTQIILLIKNGGAMKLPFNIKKSIPAQCQQISRMCQLYLLHRFLL